jgi:transcriptional regulator with XRE-family HTH domain
VTIAQAVANLRAAHGATLEQFARRLGVGVTTLWKWESTCTPRRKSLERLYEIATLHGLTDLAAVFRDQSSVRHALSRKGTQKREASR